MDPNELNDFRAALGDKPQQAVETIVTSKHLGRLQNEEEVGVWVREEYASGLTPTKEGGGQFDSSAKCRKEIVKQQAYFEKLNGNSLPGVFQQQQKDIADLDDNVIENMSILYGHNSQVLDKDLSKKPTKSLAVKIINVHNELSEKLDNSRSQVAYWTQATESRELMSSDLTRLNELKETERKDKEALADLETEVKLLFNVWDAIHAKVCLQKERRNLVDAKIKALTWLEEGLAKMEREVKRKAEVMKKTFLRSY